MTISKSTWEKINKLLTKNMEVYLVRNNRINHNAWEIRESYVPPGTTDGIKIRNNGVDENFYINLFLTQIPNPLGLRVFSAMRTREVVQHIIDDWNYP
jgi:hypothetical protein